MKSSTSPIPKALLALVLLLAHCFSAECAPAPDDAPPAYVSPGAFYAPGSLNVQVIKVARGSAPVPLDIYAPEEANNYPVVMFLPGFTASRRHYETILRHLASHGFVVVAPQMYREGCYFCAPPPALEAAEGLILLGWIRRRLSDFVPAAADMQPVGIAGHSRGGQIAFRMALAAGDRIAAVAGVDPVDGLEMFAQTKITDSPFALDTPAYILGTGLGPVMPDNAVFPLACAPADIGHAAFYAVCGGPAWHAVATEYGHADMLDEEDFVGGVCPGGPDRDSMRAFAAGTLAAFFSGVLQGNAAALQVLTDPDSAPLACVMETK